MLEIIMLHTQSELEELGRGQFVDFMFESLGQFGDPKKDINKSLDYAFSKEESAGGFVLAAYENQRLVGGVIMNRTGMGGYIPDWVLVYVAVDPSCRGRGYGKEIIEYALEHCDGDVKLHVEYENPAKRLYERIGFDSKYAEMRFQK